MQTKIWSVSVLVQPIPLLSLFFLFKLIFMAYLTKEELKTHMYDEVTDEISRADDTIVDSAIAAGVEETRSYLTNYDVDAVFAAEGADRNPIILLYAKDLTIWHFISLSQAAMEVGFRESRYDKAIRFLKDVQAGKANPSLPIRDQGDGITPGAGYQWDARFGGNTKRNNSY